MASVIGTRQPVVLFPASGTGAWEAALANSLSQGDRVLMAETGPLRGPVAGHRDAARADPLFLPGDWRRGVDAARIGTHLAEDRGHAIKAVCVVHNETSTGVTSDIAAVRRSHRRSAASGAADGRHDLLAGVHRLPARRVGRRRHGGSFAEGADAPPGLSFNAVGERALAAHGAARLPRSYWDWGPVLQANRKGFFPYTPPTNLLFGLREALRMLQAEGFDRVFARHDRHAEATRRAVRAWGLELLCANPSEYSSSLTAVLVPDGHDAGRLLEAILDRFDMALGVGLGKLAGRVFRIGHLGDFNDLSLMGTLAGVEMGLGLADIPHRSGASTPP